jgi:hypothetical protein
LALLLIIDKPGQLCNQLWSYLNMVAIAKVTNSRMILLIEDDLFKYFDCYPSKGTLVLKPDSYYFKFIKYISRFFEFSFEKSLFKEILIFKPLNHDSHNSYHELYKKIKSGRAYFVNSWDFRRFTDVNLMQDSEIKTFFRFKRNLSLSVDKSFNDKSQSKVTLVGVHIRRGDYNNFQNGKFYFDHTIYAGYMYEFLKKSQFELVQFFISSNEDIPTQVFKDFNWFNLSNSSGPEDLYGLSKCVYIIGPPSTFNMWAAYYGNSNLFVIDSPSKPLSIDKFRKVYAQDIFDDKTNYSNKTN